MSGSLSKASRSRSFCKSFADADGFGGSSLPINQTTISCKDKTRNKTDAYYTTPFPEGERVLNFVLVSSLLLTRLCVLYFSSSFEWVCEQCMQTGGP